MKIKNVFIINILEWLIYMLGYTTILITISMLFKNTLYIDNSAYGMWAFLAAIVIFILNKILKPVLVWLTLPITAMTLGLFYPLINVLILNIVDVILGMHFKMQGILMSIIVAVVISLMNFILKRAVIEPIIGGNNE